ncbi:MAG: ribosome maturation factor RimP [Oscillospiraceae bacterium]|nr:ribosome maturation factor RimP [Oscillospiraceae bacterium]
MPNKKPHTFTAHGGGNTADRCRTLGEPVAASLGLRIWDVQFVKEGSVWILRYILDRDSGVDMNACVAFTRLINPALDAADPVEQSYCLEVSSPGIDRELTRPEHFEEFIDAPVTIQLIRPADGVRDFAGILASYADGIVTVRQEDGTSRSFAKKETAKIKLIDSIDFDAE